MRPSPSTASQAIRSFLVSLKGDALLHNPRFNKGTAFTREERKAFDLVGRLPSRVNTLDEQCDRAYAQLQSRGPPGKGMLRKNTFLQSLREQNWVLFYELMRRHLDELVPVIYTPTAAEAIEGYSHLFRRSEGLYLTFNDQDTMEEDFLAQIKGRKVDLVVCSDGEAILGIGDQGVGAIGISLAKSAIYSVIGGVDPSKTLSVALDVGTDNETLLNDTLYVGWEHKRIRGKEYDDFMNKFFQIVKKHLPHSLLHFEDFGLTNADRLLKRYRNDHAVFNDDIQGTGAVTLSCVITAAHLTHTPLSAQRVVIYGAGTAGLGIATQLRDAMVSIDHLTREEANKRFFLLDKHGLIKESLVKSGLAREEVKEFARPDSEWANASKSGESEVGLLEVVKNVKPTVLVGCSTHAGAFTEEVVKTMANGCQRPVILALSNPVRLSEVKPQDALNWTGGRALVATGSPFPPVKLEGSGEVIIAECNNALVYPGLGLGAVLARSKIISDTMIIAAAQRLAELSPALKQEREELEQDRQSSSSPGLTHAKLEKQLKARSPAPLLPNFGEAPEVSKELAIAVLVRAIREGNSERYEKKGFDVKKLAEDEELGRRLEKEMREKVERKIWKPEYGQYKFDPQGDR